MNKYLDLKPGSETRVVRAGDRVQSLEKGLQVLKAFNAEHAEMSLSDVARRTGLTRPAARRFLLTLVGLGYVRANDRLFSLTPRVLELGQGYLASLGLPEVARPHLDDFGRLHTESISLAVLDGHDVIMVANSNARGRIVVAYTVGSRFPWHATSLGRVLVAYAPSEVREQYLSSSDIMAIRPNTVTDRSRLKEILETTRKQGYALIDEELEEGIRALAVPIRNRAGDVVAAINVSIASRTSNSKRLVDELLEPLTRTARQIEADLVGIPNQPRAQYEF